MQTIMARKEKKKTDWRVFGLEGVRMKFELRNNRDFLAG